MACLYTLSRRPIRSLLGAQEEVLERAVCDRDRDRPEDAEAHRGPAAAAREAPSPAVEHAGGPVALEAGPREIAAAAAERGQERRRLAGANAEQVHLVGGPEEVVHVVD